MARCLSFLLLLSLMFQPAKFSAVEAQTSLKYQEPPKGIVELVDVRPTPHVEISPADQSGTRWLLIAAISGLASVADLAQPELRLAGLRFNPKTNGPSRGRYVTALSLKALPDGVERPIAGLPAGAKIRFFGWAPDAHHLFFVNATDEAANPGLSLWIVDAKSRRPGVSKVWRSMGFSAIRVNGWETAAA